MVALARPGAGPSRQEQFVPLMEDEIRQVTEAIINQKCSDLRVLESIPGGARVSENETNELEAFRQRMLSHLNVIKNRFYFPDRVTIEDEERPSSPVSAPRSVDSSSRLGKLLLEIERAVNSAIPQLITTRCQEYRIAQSGTGGRPLEFIPVRPTGTTELEKENLATMERRMLEYARTHPFKFPEHVITGQGKKAPPKKPQKSRTVSPSAAVLAGRRGKPRA